MSETTRVNVTMTSVWLVLYKQKEVQKVTNHTKTVSYGTWNGWQGCGETWRWRKGLGRERGMSCSCGWAGRTEQPRRVCGCSLDVSMPPAPRGVTVGCGLW